MNLPLIHLIRHGQTEWSLSGRHTGTTDVDLTAHGEEEARQLAGRLQKIQFAHVFTSPRKRARRTCELAGLGEKAVVEPRLAEWNYGDYEGLVLAEIKKRSREDWNIFKHGCPGGESPQQMTERVDQLIETLQGLKGNIAVFSHGHLLRALAIRWVRLPMEHAGRLDLDTGTLGQLGFDHDSREEHVIRLWNTK